MKIFITGGSGFIGTNLIKYLSNLKHEILNLDKNPPRDPSQKKYWKEVNILNKNLLIETMLKFDPEVVLHLAARTDLDGKTLKDYKENVEGTSNLIECLKLCINLKKVLFFSSRLVCKTGYVPINDTDYCPSTFYGESKVASEKMIRQKMESSQISWVILRPTSIWGPWFEIPYKDFFVSVLKSRYVHPKSMRITKSFGYIGNSVFIINKFINFDPIRVTGKTYYLTDYPEIELKNWADIISNESGSRAIIEVPVSVLKFIAIFGDMLKILGYKNPPLTTFRLNNLLTTVYYDTTELQELCGELPYSLRDGVTETLSWLHTTDSRD